METKRVTVDFANRSQISFSGESIKSQMDAIETNFKACDDILNGAGLDGINYQPQAQEISTVAEMLPILTAYVASVPLQVESELDKPLTEDFQNKVIPALTDIVIKDIKAQCSYSAENYSDLDGIDNMKDPMTDIMEIGLENFLTLASGVPLEDMQSLENMRAIQIFTNLFREEFESQMATEIRNLNGNPIMPLIKLCMEMGEITEETLMEYEKNEQLQEVSRNLGWLSYITDTIISAGLSALQDVELMKAGSNNGSVLLLPEPGETITVSKGINKFEQHEYESAIVSSYNAWSTEYSIEKCNSIYGSNDKCRIRLNYAVENYECNSTDNDLLMFNLEGYERPVFAGAMVDGYADIGDIVHVTLEDSNSFDFLILDVKNTQHTVDQLAEKNQCQCEWGHGYFLDPIGDTSVVQLQVCEFILAGNCSEDSAIHTESGAFLTKHRVVKTQIVDHILIEDEYK